MNEGVLGHREEMDRRNDRNENDNDKVFYRPIHHQGHHGLLTYLTLPPYLTQPNPTYHQNKPHIVVCPPLATTSIHTRLIGAR